MTHLKQLQTKLIELNMDAAIISDKLNQRYLSGFDFEDGLLLVCRKNAYLLTDFRYREAAKEEASREFEVLTPAEGHLACIHTLLAENDACTVGIEECALSVADYQKYSDALKDRKLCAGISKALTELRMYKDDAELDTIARAQAVTDAAFAHILDWIKPDMTEIEVALELEFFMRSHGAEALAFPTIAVSGTNSSRPHGVPGYEKLQKGFLTMDFGARVDGYCSDMTRTVVLGKADDEMKRLYQTVLSAQRASLAAACEGVGCRELDRIARDLIDEAGYRGCFGHSLGHGVGLLIHESPRLSAAASPDTVLKRGHVVTFEPGIYLEGKYGCRIEDMACIRPDGTFFDFTNSPKELIELF